MRFGFSYIGLLYLIMLFTPNIIWTKNMPDGYEKYAKQENKLFLIFERCGQVAVTCTVLIFSDFNITRISLRSVWLLLSFIFMILYEAYWIRYFKSGRTMRDFYGSFLKIPLPGAVLPVISFMLLGIYGRNLILIVAVIILGIGHIGIHENHRRQSIQNEQKTKQKKR